MKQLPYTGKDVGICILDTGIAADHPDFRGRTQAFADFISYKRIPYDDNGHGTHVAGILLWKMELLQEENTEESLLAVGLQF